MKNIIVNNKKIFIVFLFFLGLFLSSGVYLLSTAQTIDKNILLTDSKMVATSASEEIIDQNNLKENKIGPIDKIKSNKAQKVSDKFITDVKSAPVITAPVISPDKPAATTTVPDSFSETVDVGRQQILFINDKKYELNIKESSTVYDLMVALKKRGDFDFKGVDSAGLGFFVEEINGIKNNPRDNKYWIYYVNGKSATTGITGYRLMPDDIITWKYEKPRF